MASVVKIFNTREHEIVLNTPKAAVFVARATPSPDDKNKTVPGIAEIDEALLNEAKKSPVVQFYFSEGWLKMASGKSKE
jgi:hypothetical protein